MEPKTEQEQENSYRRTVKETIETLIDVESVSEIQIHLKNLHNLDWDEVIEERFLNKQCGFPACPRAPPKKRPQMYQIDRKEGKIYESCKQRNKFCSERCYHKSFFVRNQLEQEPLWITGYSEKRMKKEYNVPEEESFACEMTENEDPVDCLPRNEPSVEFVADSLIAKVKEMKVNEEFEEPKELEEPEKESYKLTEDDREFIRSIREFKGMSFGGAARNSKTTKPPKKTSVKLTEKNQKKEDEILEKLREKYGNKNSKQKKPPIIIDAQPLIQKTSSEVKKTETVQEKDAWIVELVKSWITAETRQMIKEGPRPSGGTSEKILMNFLSGIKLEEKTVDLPNLDKYNVKEKRLNIFLHSIRNHWMELEARLHLTPTRRDLLSRLAATFHLDAENITGWSRKEISVIVFALFIIVCMVDVELGDDYFKNEHVSPELSTVSSELCGIDSNGLSAMQRTITELISC